MVTGMMHAHSGWRYVVIAVAILTIIKMLLGWFGSGKWSTMDQRLGMAMPVVLDIQLLLGIVLWILEQRWIASDALASWEHPVTMLVAVIIAHYTWVRAKRTEDDRDKYRIASIGYIIAALVVGLGVFRITS